MAILLGGFLKGSIGNNTFRVMNNKQLVSAKIAKGQMKQTEATKKMAGVFGKASRLGKQVRETVQGSLGKKYDPAMSRRLTTDLREILSACRDSETEQYVFDEQSFSPLNGFDYNLKSPLNKSLVKKLTSQMTDGVLSIDLPASKPLDLLVFPAESSACELAIEVSLFHLASGKRKYAAAIQSLKIEKGAASIDQQHFEFKVPDGCLCVVSVFLKFYSVFRDLSTIINSKTFSPAGICVAFVTPDVADMADQKNWVRMYLNFDVKMKPVTSILLGKATVNANKMPPI